MDLNSEKQRPQKVEVVNNPNEPIMAEFSNVPMNAAGTALLVQISSSGSGLQIYSERPTSVNFIVQLDNILLLQGDGTFVPIPLSSKLTNMTTTNINNMLASYKTAYASLVSGVTAATLHYSKMTSNGVTTSEVYNLKD